MIQERIFSKSVPFLLICFTLSGCFTPKELRTDSIPVVKNFDLYRYLGTWYEIARLPHSFEEGLDRVTATYTLRDDGTIEVINRGFNTSEGEWEEAIGKAWIPDTSAGALLKVSFFWIFSADYKVIVLDTVNYSYAMVTSSSKKYLWILSRSAILEQAVYDALIMKTKVLGFPVSEVYKVRH